MSKVRGFTLVELLVVISIIGILSALVFTSFSQSQAQARDQERMATLAELQLAIERYRADTGTLPVSFGDLQPVYLDTLPDPSIYLYRVDSDIGIYIATAEGIESLFIANPDQDFACPAASGGSVGYDLVQSSPCSGVAADPVDVYAIYSPGVREF